MVGRLLATHLNCFSCNKASQNFFYYQIKYNGFRKLYGPTNILVKKAAVFQFWCSNLLLLMLREMR